MLHAVCLISVCLSVYLSFCLYLPVSSLSVSVCLISVCICLSVCLSVLDVVCVKHHVVLSQICSASEMFRSRHVLRPTCSVFNMFCLRHMLCV